MFSVFCTCSYVSLITEARRERRVSGRATWGSALLAVTERRGPEAPQPGRLSPLLARRVARLVGVPQLLAVVAELRPASVAPAGNLGAAGTAEGDDGVTERESGGVVREKILANSLSNPVIIRP